MTDNSQSSHPRAYRAKIKRIKEIVHEISIVREFFYQISKKKPKNKLQKSQQLADKEKFVQQQHIYVILFPSACAQTHT